VVAADGAVRAAGHFVLAEFSGGAALHAVLHAMVAVSGVVIMSGAAWLFSWYKHSADKSARSKGTIGNADLAGGSL
jgi:hypothetical protein